MYFPKYFDPNQAYGNIDTQATDIELTQSQETQSQIKPDVTPPGKQIVPFSSPSRTAVTDQESQSDKIIASNLNNLVTRAFAGTGNISTLLSSPVTSINTIASGAVNAITQTANNAINTATQVATNISNQATYKYTVLPNLTYRINRTNILYDQSGNSLVPS